MAWTVLPLVLLHVWMWRRSRALLRFQLLLDVGVAAVMAQALLTGGDLNPVRCLQSTPPYDEWAWSGATELQPTQSDLVLQFHPWWHAARRQVLAGRLPAMAPEIGGGLPLLANGQIGLWAPVMAPVWALGPESGTTVMALWKLEAAGLGAFLLLWRGFGLRWRAAALGGLTYGCGCYQVGWLLVPLAWVTAVLPWMWWATVASLRRRTPPVWSLALGVGVGWLAGCGLHPETAAVVAGSAVLAGLVLHPRRWPRLMVMVAVAVPVAVALAWPTIGYIQASARFQHDDQPNRTPIPLAVRVMAGQQLLVPAVHGHPGRGDWNAPYPHAPAATGVGGVALAVIAAGGVRRRHRRYLVAALAGVGVAAVLAYRVPPLDALLVRLPPLDRMNLVRFAVLVPWGLAAAAAVAVDGLESGRLRRLGWRWLPVAAMAVAAAAGHAWTLSAGSIAQVLMTIGLGAVVASWGRHTWWLAPAACLELAMLAVGINPVAAATDRVPRPALVTAVAAAIRAEPGRLIGLDGVIPPNLASRFHVADLRAFDPLRPVPYAGMMARLGEPEPVLGGGLRLAPPRLCGAWSVRYLVAPPEGLPAGWQPLWLGPGGSLWRNPSWLPEVRVARRTIVASEEDGWELLLSDRVDLASAAVVPAGGPELAASTARLQVISTEPDRVAARVECDAACLLVVARPWAPGWTATVDGQSQGLVVANLAGLGVVVPAGDHLAELSYNPWRWWGGSVEP